jgi:tRNA threonylcarbamoyladenosine biosynthesis protein TsaE
MSESLLLDAPDLPATRQLGRRLAPVLFPGAVIALEGPLGAGKTELVRAIAEGLNISDRRAVSSPTFVLIQEYEGRLPIFHFDAYRLRSPAEFFDLGAQEYFQAGGVCLIEWADKVASFLPAELLRIGIEITGLDSRQFLLEAHGERYEKILRDW